MLSRRSTSSLSDEQPTLSVVWDPQCEDPSFWSVTTSVLTRATCSSPNGHWQTLRSPQVGESTVTLPSASPLRN